MGAAQRFMHSARTGVCQQKLYLLIVVRHYCLLLHIILLCDLCPPLRRIQLMPQPI